MTTQLPFIDLAAQLLRLGGRIDAAIARVLDHGGFVMGPEVRTFEEQLAAFCGARFALGCANGTDALVLVLRAWGIGPGDAVFVPSFTFVATAEAAALVGATPIFVDVRTSDFNMDPVSLDAAIGHARELGLNPRTVVPVDLFGQPADYDAIAVIARSHGLKVMADAAQGFGSSLNGRRAGVLADATTTSFFPAKPLGCFGDGGAIFTDDEELARLLVSIRVHGQGSNKYDNVRIGLNSRLDTLQAAILIEKLAIFDEELAARQRAADRYAELLGDVVTVPALLPGRTSAWAQYTIVTDRRDAIAASCKAAGIPTAVYYPIPLHRQTGYVNYPTGPGGCPVTDQLAGKVISLPMHPYLDEAVQARVAAAVRAAF